MATLDDVRAAARKYGEACDARDAAQRAIEPARSELEAVLLAAWKNGVSEEDLAASYSWALSTLGYALKAEGHRLVPR